MARKRRTRTEPDEESAEQNSMRRNVHEEEAETSNTQRNMDEEEVEESVNRNNTDEEQTDMDQTESVQESRMESGAGGLVLVKVQKGVKAELFIHTLEKCSCSSYGRMARKAKVNVLELKWCTKDDTTDCGLFAMRHMETYMGTKVSEWKCDLTNKQSKALQLLRAKYCTAMMYNNELWLCVETCLTSV